MWTVERAREGDAETLCALLQRSLRETTTGNRAQSERLAQQTTPDQFLKRITNPNWFIGVTRKHGVMRGYIAVKDEGEYNYIDALHVLPESQGRGIGSTLLNRGIAVFPARTAQLWCDVTNTNAYAFYIRRGFSELYQTTVAQGTEVILAARMLLLL